MNKPSVVITHHAVSLRTHTVDDVDDWHKERWPEFRSSLGFWVGYHYVIDWDGTVTQTRKHNETGAHTIGMNDSSIGICFMGNNDFHKPSFAQMASWVDLYNKLPKLPTRPHRLYANKSCHGKLLPDDYFQLYHQRWTTVEKLKQIVALLTRLITQRRQK